LQKFNFVKSKIILLVLLSLAACGKEEGTSLQVNFRFKAGNDDFQYNTPYLINGTKTEFTTVKFYVSEPSFTTEEGETFTLSETYFLVSPNSEACEMKINPGKYSWFRFGLGVNPSRNASS